MSLLIAGSIVPCLYYGFYCSIFPKIIYTCVTLVLCAASVIVSFYDKFSDAHYRHVRAIVFTSYALSSLVPAIHWYLTHGGLTQLATAFHSAIFFIFLMATLYITGVLFYALRIPERFYPGKFDLYVRHQFQLSFILTNLLFYPVSLPHLISHFCFCGRHFSPVWPHYNG